ncbi:toll/interleukin-1 receptor domain-containing protein [Rodentibacter haemolyticus]|uniref:Toll/interleukin-1 receptor domain-containing protein n=1 Tax=Rodentibacter haemolyticus TaxID=2778911 RepID=A0ABX6UXB2_9PAST|nr:toll/interleukin-1 receptor domain-containing protein [Rodentibacter haemolyticus]QPB41910.1 toll/interleukin-1 receptor domain-containing protein [Rodentibacter haemolyticus]
MNLFTYVFENDYLNRVPVANFIKDILNNFTTDEITNVGIWVNNNPWRFEFFTFVTMDSNFISKESFDNWLENNHSLKSILHNVFIGDLSISGNIATFVSAEDPIFTELFNSSFLFNEEYAKYISCLSPEQIEKQLTKCSQKKFEADKPQYQSVKKQIPAVFISYASDDNDLAIKVSNYLCAKEIPIWLDRNEIKEKELRDNELILKKLCSGLELCKVAIFILTNNFFQKYWTKKELEICRQLEKKIILLDNNHFADIPLYKEIISQYEYIKIDNIDKFIQIYQQV